MSKNFKWDRKFPIWRGGHATKALRRRNRWTMRWLNRHPDFMSALR